MTVQQIATNDLPFRFQKAKLRDFDPRKIEPAIQFVDSIIHLPEDTPERRHMEGQGWVETGDMLRNFRGLDGLVIVGPTGVGKTHLMSAIANELFQRERLFRSALAIVDEAKDAVGGRGSAFPYHTYPSVLMLDDLSGIRPTDFALDVITRIVRVRYDESLPTIVTMHSSRDAIKSLYGQAIASRLVELGPVLKLDGPDRRAPA